MIEITLTGYRNEVLVAETQNQALLILEQIRAEKEEKLIPKQRVIPKPDPYYGAAAHFRPNREPGHKLCPSTFYKDQIGYIAETMALKVEITVIDDMEDLL